MSGAGVLIVGASIAAVTAAATLRAEGYDGSVTMLGQEPHPPYARPPLSKTVLTGVDDPASTALPLTGLDVQVRTDACATGLDPGRRRVRINDAEDIPYDQLVIATGARARKANLEDSGELALRSLADAGAISDALRRKPSVLIIGAGVLGFELASACRSRGVEVTMVDVAEPLVAQLGPVIARILVRRARDAGVHIIVSPGGVSRRFVDGHPYVELGDGTRLEADLIVTSIGCVPNIEWLRDSGLPLAQGLLVDDRCRVAPGIVAAGDLVRVLQPGGAYGHRTPNWTDAINQARVAASALVRGDGEGGSCAYVRDPYFWTEAFGLSVKVAGGLPIVGTAEVLAEGEDSGRLLQWLEGGRPVAAAAINHRIPVVRLKKLSREAA